MKTAVDEARLSIEVTKRCNSSCIHCFAGAGKNHQSEINFVELRNIIKEGADAGYRHLHITGGEPLLYKDLFEAIDLAGNIGYKTILLNTNGLLLDRSVCHKLAKIPGLTLSVSLEGSEVLHNSFRGHETYKKTIAGLESGLEAGLNIILFSIICKSLLPDLGRFGDDVFSRFQEIKYLTLIRLLNQASDNAMLRQEYLDLNDWPILVRSISLLNLYGRPTILLNDPLINVVARMLGIPWVPASKDLCYQGALTVMADLSLDVSHSSRVNLGKYAPGSIQKVLSSELYRQAVTPDTQVCPTCQFGDYCNGSGLFRPLYIGTNDQANKLYCRSVLAKVMENNSRRFY